MEPKFGRLERESINSYMENPGWLTEYKKTAEFEKKIAAYCGVKHAIAVNNGTISLTLAALAVGVKPGDEVIVPNFTMVATANSMKMIGAIPIFIDVEPQSFCLDINLLKDKITKKTKAIIFVNINGRSPSYDIQDLIDFCKVNKLQLIEDSAQALGSLFSDGTHMGTKGVVGSLSFSAPKIISTGQGGMLLTNSDEISNKIRRLKDFGRSKGGNDIHEEIGFNCKFTELQACIGLAQMKQLEDRVKRKKEIWSLYFDLLQELPNIQILPLDTSINTPWFIDILATERDNLRQYLHENGIGTRNMYPPINKQKCYSIEGSYPVSESIGNYGLWLPSSSHITDAEIKQVCKCIKQFFEK